MPRTSQRAAERGTAERGAAARRAGQGCEQNRLQAAALSPLQATETPPAPPAASPASRARPFPGLAPSPASVRLRGALLVLVPAAWVGPGGRCSGSGRRRGSRRAAGLPCPRAAGRASGLCPGLWVLGRWGFSSLRGRRNGGLTELLRRSLA